MRRLLVLLLLPLVASCSHAGSVAAPDQDGDGFAADAGDCDDGDPEVSPVAEETCNGKDDDCDRLTDELDASGSQSWFQDADGDGYGDAGSSVTACEQPPGFVTDESDCDDADSAVNPDATETCDGVDQDCDEEADEEAVDRDDWFLDTDGDGYGIDAESTTACEAPVGFAPEGGDCDDGDAAIRPGTPEVCDGLDQDCDGDIDEDPGEGAVTRYADRDGDGYGDPDDPGAWCSGAVPSGWTDDDTDCDDGNPAVYPGASGEVCNDGVDQDCDGEPMPCVETLGSSGRSLVGESTGDGAGDAVASCDLDGDGNADLLVAAASRDEGGNGAGAVYRVIGPHSAGSADLGSAADAWWLGAADEDGAGTGLACAGDLDRDGLVDLIAGAPGVDDGGTNAGGAYVVVGADAGESTLDDAGLLLVGERSNDEAGAPVGAAGDLDDDGWPDLWVAAPSNDRGGANAGTVFVTLGPFDTGSADLADADAILYGVTAYDQAGAAAALAGDLDGDGLDDLAIGAALEDSAGSSAGAVYIVLGTPGSSLELGDADAILLGSGISAQAGAALAGGVDMDGDGLDDLAIGAPGDDSGVDGGGAAWILAGAAALPAGSIADRASMGALGAEVGGALGESVALGGDVDGDGALDLVAGSTLVGGPDEGGAFLFLGPLSGTVSTTESAVAWSGAAAGDAAGSALTFVEGVGGRGRDGLFVGIPSADDAGTDSGSAILVWEVEP